MREVPEVELPAKQQYGIRRSEDAPAQDAGSKVISAQLRAQQEGEVAIVHAEGEKGEKKIKLIKWMGENRQQSDTASAQDEQTPVIGS